MLKKCEKFNFLAAHLAKTDFYKRWSPKVIIKGIRVRGVAQLVVRWLVVRQARV
jgi:hypothetical protein